MARDYDSNTDYEPNPDDERTVDLGDEGEPPAPPPTLDPDEMLEDSPDTVPPLDDEREESAW